MDALGHLAIEATQGMMSNFIPMLLGTLLSSVYRGSKLSFFFISHPHPTPNTHTHRVSIMLGASGACGGLADSTSRLSLTKYILSWSEEVLTEDFDILLLVHGYRNLHQVINRPKSIQSYNIKICLEALLTYGVSLMGFPPDKYPPITLPNGHLELIGEDDLTHWGRDKMAAIWQTMLSNAFSWMKMVEFRLKFYGSLFLRVQLTISQHWVR